jgi:hypothetical protein
MASEYRNSILWTVMKQPGTLYRHLDLVAKQAITGLY